MNLKQICLRTLGIFTAIFILPLAIFSYGRNSNKFNRTAVLSAGLSTVGFQSNYSNTDDSNNTEIPAGVEISSNNLWDMNMAPEEKENTEIKCEIPNPLPVEDVTDKIPYPDNLTDHDGEIEKFTYGHYDSSQYFDLDNGGQVRNCTEVSSSELYEYSKQKIPFKLDKNSSQPQVLIYHTHATESFEIETKNWYDKSFSCKTTEREKNIISVGDEICKQLDEAGILYIHDTSVHDYPSYDNSYQSSRAAVQEILDEYPSIKICLDIHRDAIEREDGTRIAPVVEINGKEAAQIMIISCCDDGSGDIPNFLDNFAFASNLQSALENDWNGLTRPILFDTRFYNQDLSVGCLLIEVGSHGNSLEQVQYSGELIGKTLVNLFNQ